jgi:ankyrin repeat protein
LEVEGVDVLILVGCGINAVAAGHFLAEISTHLVPELRAQGGTLLAEFAGNDNVEGVRMLLDLGVSVDARYDGDPYFNIAKDSTALHVAAWKAWPRTVKLLIERGAPVNAQDAERAYSADARRKSMRRFLLDKRTIT